jgi:hypothetical protein
MPRTTGERAWVEGLKQANQTLYREVMALISSRGEYFAAAMESMNGAR